MHIILRFKNDINGCKIDDLYLKPKTYFMYTPIILGAYDNFPDLVIDRIINDTNDRIPKK